MNIDIVLKKLIKCQLEEKYEAIDPRVTELMKKVAPSRDDETLEEHDMLDP